MRSINPKSKYLSYSIARSAYWAAATRWIAAAILLALLSATALAQTTLVPASYTTTSGSDSGAPVSNIQALDQSGLGNSPSKQVTFITSPSVTYAGYRVYNLPGGTAPIAVTR